MKSILSITLTMVTAIAVILKLLSHQARTRCVLDVKYRISRGAIEDPPWASWSSRALCATSGSPPQDRWLFDIQRKKERRKPDHYCVAENTITCLELYCPRSFRFRTGPHSLLPSEHSTLCLFLNLRQDNEIRRRIIGSKLKSRL